MCVRIYIFIHVCVHGMQGGHFVNVNSEWPIRHGSKRPRVHFQTFRSSCPTSYLIPIRTFISRVVRFALSVVESTTEYNLIAHYLFRFITSTRVTLRMLAVGVRLYYYIELNLLPPLALFSRFKF